MSLTTRVKTLLRREMANNGASKELFDAVNAAIGDTTGVLIEETVTLTNAASTNLVGTLPAGAVVTTVAVNLQTAVVGDGSGDVLFARVGLGIAGTPAKYGVTTAKAKNNKITKIIASAVLASAETLGLYAVKADGSTAATEKFTAGATVKVRVWYTVPVAIADAA